MIDTNFLANYPSEKIVYSSGTVHTGKKRGCVIIMKQRLSVSKQKKRVSTGLAAFLIALSIGGAALVQQSNSAPKLPVYTNPDMVVIIAEEETPLAAKPVLKSSRPKTYKAVKSAIDSITDKRISIIKKYYAPNWR